MFEADLASRTIRINCLLEMGWRRIMISEKSLNSEKITLWDIHLFRNCAHSEQEALSPRKLDIFLHTCRYHKVGV